MSKNKQTSEEDVQKRDILGKKMADWYLKDKLSAPQIAKQEGVSCSSLTVLNILREQGVQIRSKGKYAVVITDDKVIENMIEDYIENKMSFLDLSVKYNKNQNTIYYHLKKHGLVARKMKKLNENAQKDIKKKYTLQPTKDTIAELAKKYNVTRNAVKYHALKQVKEKE